MGSSSTPTERRGMNPRILTCGHGRVMDYDRAAFVVPRCRCQGSPGLPEGKSKAITALVRYMYLSTSLADFSRRCSCMKRSHPIPSHPVLLVLLLMRVPLTLSHTLVGLTGRGAHLGRLSCWRRGTRVSILPSSPSFTA
jgi:hypothetical protein